jgi:hypothetical protein
MTFTNEMTVMIMMTMIVCCCLSNRKIKNEQNRDRDVHWQIVMAVGIDARISILGWQFGKLGDSKFALGFQYPFYTNLFLK